MSLYPKLPRVNDSLDFVSGDWSSRDQVDEFYSDGSGGKDTLDPLLRRCGWGYVGCKNGSVVFGRGGGLVG